MLSSLLPRFLRDTTASMANLTMTEDLVEGWEFKQSDTDDWMPVKRVPTNVHLDLMANDKCEV